MEGLIMESLALLEKYYEEAKKRGARPELLVKMESQILREKSKNKHKQNYDNKFKTMFEKATCEIEKRYINGTLEYIETFDNDLYNEINNAINEVDKVWIAGRTGNATIEKFREILKKWYLLNLKAIDIYKRLAIHEKTES